MAKRRGDRSRPTATDDAIIATEAEEVGADDGGGDGGRNDANCSHLSEPKPSLWDEVQHSLSELMPLISRPENLLITVLASGVDEHDAGDADAAETALANNRETVRVHPATQQLLVTSQQLFRYIEYLASIEVKLKELQRQQKASRADAAIGGSRPGTDDDGVKSLEAEEKYDDEPCSLSGLSSLYTGNHQSNTINNDDATCVVDAETIWGQVDLQNQVLMSRLKKMIKKLSKRVGSSNNDDDERVIRILHTSGSMMDSDDEDEDEEEEDGDEEMSQGSAASNYELKGEDDEGEGTDEHDYDSDEDNDGDANDERRRIRDRMEKAMEEMSDDDEDIMGQDKEAEDDNNIIELFSKSSRRKTQTMEDDSDTDVDTNHEDTLDPTREDLRDGFFDLHEMEAFADEEEEMLPDDAYGEEDPEDDAMEAKKGKGKKKAILPHVRDRLGIDSDDDGDDVENEGSGDEDDEDDDPLSKRFQPTSVRRKKYRADDEVEALYQIYEDVNNNDEDSDGSENERVVDASTMTAADFFGQPNRNLIRKYKSKIEEKAKPKGKQNGTNQTVKASSKSQAKTLVDNDDDNDSWDNHNFEEEGLDWKGNGEVESEENAESIEDQVESGDEEDDVDDHGIINNNQKLSSHAKQLQKLKDQTISIEQDMMSEKPWKMMGEAKGTDRATDSLLEATPEFEVAFKPPPILTPEHAADIEEMIKKRIIEEDWDDVIPRELPDIGGHKRGGDAPEVSQEKSKLGLGELYEREYLKKTAGYDRDAHEKQTEEDAAKEEMKQLFANLCSQLDALSNYHFAPRPVADMADVQSREDVPAIAMEEVLPLHVSQSRGMTPEEVYAAGKGRKSVLKGESELEQGERKSVRNAKKAARRKARKQKHADERLISKLQPGLGLNNPYEKRKLREELQMARASGKVVVASDNKGVWKDDAAAGKEYQTSAKFFAKMQENVETMLRDDGNGGEERSKKKRKGLEAGQASSVYRL